MSDVRDFKEVWEGHDDETILTQLPMLVKRMIQVLRFHGEDAFIESEPNSALAALEVLRDRHAS